MSEHKRQSVHQNNTMDDEFDLMVMWSVLVEFKRLIFKSVFGAAILAAGISLLMPNVYRAEVLLAPAVSEDNKGGLGSALGSMGGLASMAGISIGGGGSSTEEGVAVLKSREFLWQFSQKNNLMPILFEDDWDAKKKRWNNDDPKKQPGQWHVYRLMIKNKMLDVQVDKKTGFVTLAIEWEDAALAAKMTNDLVAQLNQYLAKQSIDRSERNLKYLKEELAHTQIEEMRKMLFDLIASEQKSAMMANTQKDYVFKVLDSAIEPDKKIKPKRALIVIGVSVLAGFIAVLYAFLGESISCRRKRLTEEV